MRSVKDEFLSKFCEVATDEKVNGVRLQKKRYVRKYSGQDYTITIERGDKLNK